MILATGWLGDRFDKGKLAAIASLARASAWIGVGLWPSFDVPQMLLLLLLLAPGESIWALTYRRMLLRRQSIVKECHRLFLRRPGHAQPVLAHLPGHGINACCLAAFPDSAARRSGRHGPASMQMYGVRPGRGCNRR
jgi:hypothetical protein